MRVPGFIAKIHSFNCSGNAFFKHSYSIVVAEAVTCMLYKLW